MFDLRYVSVWIVGVTNMSLLLQAYGCTSGTVSLKSTSGNNFTGILQYCYGSSSGDELIPVCGESWNRMLSELVCRAILNTTNSNIVTRYERTSVSSGMYVQLNCGGQTLSSCTSTLTLCNIATYIGCHGSCTDNRCTCGEGYGGFLCSSALCSPSCSDGGQCMFPDECRCTSGWQGDTCDTRNNEAICTHNCSNRGNCTLPDICECADPQWTGNDCSEPICDPQCENSGSCVEPNVCMCTQGWDGSTCSEALCIQECMNGGNCTRPNTCTCTEHWKGQNCTTAICNPPCVNGDCVSPDTCNCSEGWNGTICSEAICTSPCINGNCDSPDICSCNLGWNGTSCTEAICTLQCENGGQCTAPDTCDCTDNWTGETCTIAVCDLGFCRNGGICYSPNTNCSCTDQWTGDRCEDAVCSLPCLNGGRCAFPDVCNCTTDWKGETCSEAICREDFCLNGGNCSYPNTKCSCTEEWTGSRCETAICDDGFCLNGGECLYPNIECKCPSQWEGSQCDIAICSPGFCDNEGNCSTPDTSCTCSDDWGGPRCRTAICDLNFCKNGGICLYPNTNCTCSMFWNGSTCEEVDYSWLAIFLALCVIVPVIFTIFICVIVRQCKKWKQDSKKRSLFEDDIKDISAPIVNPFLNDTKSKDSQVSIAADEKTDETKLGSAENEQMECEASSNVREQEESPTGGVLSCKGKVQASESQKEKVKNSGILKEEQTKESKEIKPTIKEQSVAPAIGVMSGDLLEDIKMSMRFKQERSKDEELPVQPSQHSVSNTYDKLPISTTHSSGKEIGELKLKSSAHQFSSEKENSSASMKEDNSTSTTRNKFTSKEGITSTSEEESNSISKEEKHSTSEKGNSSSDVYAVPSKQKKQTESTKKGNSTSTKKDNSNSANENKCTSENVINSPSPYATPIVHKKKTEAANKFAGYEMPIDSDGHSSKEAKIEPSEPNGGYSIPISKKKRSKSEKSPKKVSIKDRREKDAGYENPLPSNADDEKKANVSIQGNDSLHYAVSARKCATLPPTRSNQPHYHVLENGLPSPTSPTQPPSSAKPESAQNPGNHEYSTLEPPRKQSNEGKMNNFSDSRKPAENQPHVYHTLEQRSSKPAAVGSAGLKPANIAADWTPPQVCNHGDEYAVPIDHIKKDTSDSKEKHDSHVYHILEKQN